MFAEAYVLATELAVREVFGAENIASTLVRLGVTCRACGDDEGAASHLEEAYRQLESNSAPDHDDGTGRTFVARTLGSLHAAADRRDQALAWYRTAWQGGSEALAAELSALGLIEEVSRVASRWRGDGRLDALLEEMTVSLERDAEVHALLAQEDEYRPVYEGALARLQGCAGSEAIARRTEKVRRRILEPEPLRAE